MEFLRKRPLTTSQRYEKALRDLKRFALCTTERKYLQFSGETGLFEYLIPAINPSDKDQIHPAILRELENAVKSQRKPGEHHSPNKNPETHQKETLLAAMQLYKQWLENYKVSEIYYREKHRGERSNLFFFRLPDLQNLALRLSIQATAPFQISLHLLTKDYGHSKEIPLDLNQAPEFLEKLCHALESSANDIETFIPLNKQVRHSIRLSHALIALGLSSSLAFCISKNAVSTPALPIEHLSLIDCLPQMSGHAQPTERSPYQKTNLLAQFRPIHHTDIDTFPRTFPSTPINVQVISYQDPGNYYQATDPRRELFQQSFRWSLECAQENQWPQKLEVLCQNEAVSVLEISHLNHNGLEQKGHYSFRCDPSL